MESGWNHAVALIHNIRISKIYICCVYVYIFTLVPLVAVVALTADFTKLLNLRK